ncbi:MAG: homocysteine S-methyltransferase family protein [Anaerolineae bacterium]|nr:homocysteine S-methyltransferase family protein [Anaerolineae bacterium]
MPDPFAIPFSRRDYLDALEDHVILFDGATGTQLARMSPAAADFGGERTEGLNEMLLLHRPDLVEATHAAYLAAGAEAIETNSFRANRLTLAEFGVSEMALDLNRRAAQLARRVADRVALEVRAPRFVAGSMGPTGRLLSLEDADGESSFDLLTEVYAEAAQGLLEGGVDVLLLETQQDLLELKAAILGVWHTFRRLGVRVPLQAQITLDAGGRMLTGPDVAAAAATLMALPVDIVGINCSTGPEEMRDAVRRLVALSPRPVCVMPNAGMPQNIGGKAIYTLAPRAFAAAMVEFATWGVRAVGGCCGTGPEHIEALGNALALSGVREGLSNTMPVKTASVLPLLASSVQAVALHQEPRPLLVGERINTQGSKAARTLMLEERYPALVTLAEEQVGAGAHVLDVCVALTERADEVVTMARVVALLARNTDAPLMLDTTDLAVMRAALKRYPGRAIINSVNLEGGEARAREILTLAREFGAALIALTIDETGMARTAEHKLAVARRLYGLAVDEIGLPPHALIFDPLTFTLATGDSESAGAALETLIALRRIKLELPGALTNLGVSNVSYGLRPAARRVLNSVFLFRAVEAGLDVAIVNPAQITPYADIPPVERALADEVIFNRRVDALTDFIAAFEGQRAADENTEAPSLDPAMQLHEAVLRRRREGVEALVEACLALYPPLEVLNAILLPAMKEVGDRFGAGELILPFVLQSAEVMKSAVARLEQALDRSEGVSKGVVVLATVFGDVHDIGKNLVKTILANNGYTVHDLGKQVPIDAILDQAVLLGADAIGLSALLVATSREMARAVEELQRRGLAIPLLVGGAAINPSFAQRIAIPEGGTLYRGGVYYCKDAFEALQVLEHVVMFKSAPTAHDHDHDHDHDAAPDSDINGGEAAIAPEGRQSGVMERPTACAACAGCASVVSSAAPALQIPTPPFWGYRALTEIPRDELFELLDRKSLYRVGWGARGAKGAAWDALQAEFDARLAQMWPAASYLHPQALYGYFPVASTGETLLVYDPRQPEARREIARFTFPRLRRGEACLCLADYFASVENDVVDVAAFQVVTVGASATERFGALNAVGEYSDAYFVHGLAANVTEALAEWLHRRIRGELGLVETRGKRYSWGYPACPDMEGHRILFGLLPAETALKLHLSSAYQLIPEYSTAAIVVHHPKARYLP